MVENSNRNFWKTVGIGLSIVSFGIALAVGGYLYVASKNTPIQTACTLEAKLCPDGSAVGRSGPKCEFSPCPTPIPDPTASWKTYTNNVLGFTFKYPETFEIKSLASAIPNNSDIAISSPASSTDAMHITLTVVKNTNNISLTEYLKEKYGQPTHPGGNPSITAEGIMKDFKITNIPLPNSSSYIGDIGGGGLSKTMFFSYKDNFYTFTLYGGTGAGAGYSPDQEKTYDQVVSTFQFTDQPVTPLSALDIAQIKQLLATQYNTTADKIILRQDEQRYSNFASGGYGQVGVGGGAAWFAAKVNNQWKIIFTGNGAIPNCSDIAQYNPPRDFLYCN